MFGKVPQTRTMQQFLWHHSSTPSPRLATVAPPLILDLLFGCTLIVGGGDHGKCAVDTNQDHGSDFNGGSPVPVHLASTLKDRIRAMDKPPTLESIPLANERIDHIDFDGWVVLDVPDRLR